MIETLFTSTDYAEVKAFHLYNLSNSQPYNIQCRELQVKHMFTPSVMLSDPSITFGGHSQGGVVTVNGVETFLTVRDVSTPFRLKQLKLTRQQAFTQGRST